MLSFGVFFRGAPKKFTCLNLQETHFSIHYHSASIHPPSERSGLVPVSSAKKLHCLVSSHRPEQLTLY